MEINRKRTRTDIVYRFKYMYHTVNRLRSFLVTWSLGHLVTWSLGLSVTRSLGHSVTWSLGHLVTWSLSHLVTRSLESLNHLITWSSCHPVLSLCHPFIFNFNMLTDGRTD